MNRILFIACCFLFIFSKAWSQEAEMDPQLKELQELALTLKYQSGNIPLLDDLATIRLEEEFQYLNPEDTEKVLVQIWGNPSSEKKSLGMIVPKGFDPLGKLAWGVIVNYLEEGYVSDEDAQKINYTDLLKQMKESVAEGSKERVKEGYDPIELVGWATPPQYDGQEHKLYWAKELHFGESKINTLNYNIRILGRKGILELNAVAGIDQLKDVEEARPKILSMVSFNPGNLYTEYNASTDKMATYGIAALVAGGVATKAGLFKGIWLGILAFKKFILIGLIAAGGWIKKLFSKKS